MSLIYPLPTIASLLAKYRIEFVPSGMTSATTLVDWKSVQFEDDDWDTPAKIRMLNDIDAYYNNIPVLNLNELLNKV